MTKYRVILVWHLLEQVRENVVVADCSTDARAAAIRVRYGKRAAWDGDVGSFAPGASAARQHRTGLYDGRIRTGKGELIGPLTCLIRREPTDE